jgi:hypothetical protein
MSFHDIIFSINLPKLLRQLTWYRNDFYDVTKMYCYIYRISLESSARKKEKYVL